MNLQQQIQGLDEQRRTRQVEPRSAGRTRRNRYWRTQYFNESLEELKKLYTESLFNTGAKETETREKLWLAVNVLGKVEQHIQQVLDTGKLAKKQLEDFRKQEESKKF